VGGYGLATLTAFDRLRLDRHYLHDVCAGAAVGIMGTEVAYFLKRKIIKDERLDLSFTGQTVSLAYRF
jgi:membrane-associated phospholipid phosphatase